MEIETIVLKKGLDNNTLKNITETINNYFKNRVGGVSNSCDENGKMVFVGTNNAERSAILNASCMLWDNKECVRYIDKWTFEDTNDPSDNCDVISELEEADRLCQRNK